MTTSLAGKTLFISGASRGIGLAIALTVARDGGNVALIAKTAEPHPKLEGTVHTAALGIAPSTPSSRPSSAGNFQARCRLTRVTQRSRRDFCP